MEKYTIPNIPTSQYILEDIADNEIVQVNNFPDKLHEGDETLQNGYAAFRNFKHLQQDLIKQSDLKSKLDELQGKLVENIAHMKRNSVNPGHNFYKFEFRQ